MRRMPGCWRTWPDIRVQQLSPADQLNYDLFRIEYENRVAAASFHPEYYESARPRGTAVTE